MPEKKSLEQTVEIKVEHFISAALFSASELAHVAGVDRKLVNVWLERELLAPTRTEHLAIRKRPMFSVIEIFKARLAKVLFDRLMINAHPSMMAGKLAIHPDDETVQYLSRLLKGAADEGWMYAVARGEQRRMPIRIFAAMSRSADEWDFFFEMDVANFVNRFPPGVPFAVIPVGEIFASVFRECEALYRGDLPRKSRKAHRASS